MPLTEIEIVDQLKKHWQIDTLTLEAEYHIPKNADGSPRNIQGGFFNKLTIPGEKDILRYPFNSELQDERISIRYHGRFECIDGKRYKINLVLDDESKRIKNPFQLRVTKVERASPQNRAAIRPQLDIFVFYGQYIHINERPCFTDLMYKETGDVIINKNGTRALAFLPMNFGPTLEENAFYEFHAQLIPDPTWGQKVKVISNTIVKYSGQPYLEVVKKCYDRMDGPMSNRILADVMREIGKGLYSSRQRMVFELLQNADDTPSGPTLIFNLNIAGNYLMVYHNGLPFSSNDVKAITSAGQSTKRSDAAKTGYKGIGFKSVFTETDEVLVRSGGFRFVFMREHPAFEDFERFYFDREEYKLYPGLKERKLKDFSQEMQTYNPSEDIPWQMIPHWESKVADDIVNSGKAGIYSNVFFAINFGAKVAAEYLKAVDVFAERPHFMLFLRNVTEFNAGPDLSVKKSFGNPVVINRVSKGKESTITYLKRVFTGIKISDDAFAAENIQLFKKQKENRSNNVTYYFADGDGKQVESIPPKLAEFDETILTLAIPVFNGMVQAEPNYLSGDDTSCIFTYLPMNEGRIRLPFLVNGDFVPSSDREVLQGDNAWNVFIMAKIAYCHVAWLEELANAASENIHTNKHYLSLVLKELLTGNFAVTALLVKYNEVYTATLSKASFILSDENSVVRADETILDQTGISNFDGGGLFYQLTKARKRLPHPEIKDSYLTPAYLNIAVFTDEQLLKILIDPVNAEVLSTFISSYGISAYQAFIGWLESFLTRTGQKLSALPHLPLIRTTDSILTFNDAISQPNLLIKLKKMAIVEDILVKAGFQFSEFYLDDYPSIYAEFQNGDHYLAKNERLFERITLAPKLTKLNPEDKNQLVKFVSKEISIGQKKFTAELKMFCSPDDHENGKALIEMTVSDLISPQSWLINHMIRSDEEVALDETFRSYLVKKDEVFKKLLATPSIFEKIALKLKQEEISDFYSYMTSEAIKAAKEDKEPFQTFNCILSDGAWKMPAEIYFSPSLVKLTSGKYDNIRKAASALSGAIFPHPATLKFIKAADLQCRSELNLSKPAILERDLLIDFLNWLDDKSFFDTVYIQENESGGYMVDTNNDVVQYFNDDPALQIIIDERSEDAGMVMLPSPLYTQELTSLGLLNGASLLEWMIDNGFADSELGPFISKLKNGNITLKYLDALEGLDLDEETEYGPKTREHIILDLLVNQSNADDAYLNSFSEKVTINGNNLATYNVSDIVNFKFKDENNRIERQFELKLSNILPVYKNSAKAVTTVLDHIIDFKGKPSLRDNVFCATEKPLKKIAAEIAADPKEYLTTWQVFYLLLFQEKFPDQDAWGKKEDFAVRFKDKDKAKFIRCCQKLMDIFYEHKYNSFLDDFTFGDSIDNGLVIGSELITGDEKVPDWLESWLQTGQTRSKITFLVQAGLQGPESQVVLLRDAVQHYKVVQYEKNLANLEDKEQLYRTLIWMNDNQLSIQLPLTAEYLKPLYKRCGLLKLNSTNLIIPVMVSSESPLYRLIDYSETGDVHLKNSEWTGYEKEIFNYVKEQKGEVIDDLMPESYVKTLSQFTESVLQQPDENLLIAQSSLLRAGFYQEWPDKVRWPVSVYPGDTLPGQALYCGHVIKKIGYGGICAVKGNYYLRRYYDLEDLMNLLGKVLPDVAMNALYRFKTEYDERKRREREEANYTEDELAALNQMFSNKVPPSFFKDLNLAALIKGLFFLKAQGYNVDEAESNLPSTHQYSHLSPVYPRGVVANAQNALTISCRSAKRGLLFLTAKAWKNLIRPDMKLYILTGKDHTDSIFCLKRDDILYDKEADFQLMRIRSGQNATAIDDVLNGESDLNDLQLVIRIRKSDRYDSVFEDVLRKQQGDTIRNVQVDNEDLY
ncbi:sacsin N-terminal ATP-binding-like domain-containing protein [Mucilaginibacter sp. 3215]|uniref:sacsin N-terminal ATP-binding-like domain-containing protein n=1 Tax=Mucilaginibacter sp. 3215 TaxID=3373912 RepID=UPI003D1E8B83